jgi:hypothetical protein
MKWMFGFLVGFGLGIIFSAPLTGKAVRHVLALMEDKDYQKVRAMRRMLEREKQKVARSQAKGQERKGLIQ